MGPGVHASVKDIPTPAMAQVGPPARFMATKELISLRSFFRATGPRHIAVCRQQMADAARSGKLTNWAC